MAKAKDDYTIDEAAEMLGVSRATVLILLDTIRPGVSPKTKTLRTSELEKIYEMLRKQAG